MSLEPSNPILQFIHIEIHCRGLCSHSTHQHPPSQIHKLSLHQCLLQTLKTADLLEQNGIAYRSNIVYYPTQFAFFPSSLVLLLRTACELDPYSNDKTTTCLLRCHIYRFWMKLLIVAHFCENGSNKLEGENYARQPISKDLALLY